MKKKNDYCHCVAILKSLPLKYVPVVKTDRSMGVLFLLSNKNLLRSYSVLATIPDARVPVVRETGAVLVFIELTFLQEKRINE